MWRLLAADLDCMQTKSLYNMCHNLLIQTAVRCWSELLHLTLLDKHHVIHLQGIFKDVYDHPTSLEAVCLDKTFYQFGRILFSILTVPTKET